MMKPSIIRPAIFALLLGAATTVQALAGSAAIGSVAGSMNATIGGQSLLPNTTIFSGDSLQVKDGVAIIAVGTSSRVIFGRETVASFLRDPNNNVNVLLTHGSVSMLHPNEGTPLTVKAGEVTVTPGVGFKSLGEVAMLNGSVVVTAKEGTLKVDGGGATKNVAKGQTIVLSPKTANNGGRGGACCGGGGNVALEIAAIGAGGTAAVLAGVAMSRSGNANTNALAAIAAANAANSTAAAAAASAAAAAAAAQQAQFLAACANDYLQQGNYNSVDQMYGGSQCPIYNPGTASGT